MTDSTQTESTETNEIIIDLFAPNLPGSTKEDDLIQKSLRDQLVKNIRNSLAFPESTHSSDVNVTRFIDESGRNVFFVDGTRGAGKTTFINSVVKRLNKDRDDSKGRIKCLPTIDPTKLPRHEPILVTVTARLNKMVSDKLKENWSSNDHKGHKERWQNHLEQLKRGLHLLTDNEYKPEYFSDALKLDAQLDYSIGGQDLSEIFDQLVKCACEILGCKAIMISFDDIDTQFDTGWDVLESIRRFFNSQKLVVVATGDLRLYSQLIRGKQYENYSKTLLDQEKESARLAERGYMVEHLEQQYLLKLFPVQKRTQLKTMLQLVGEKVNIKVKTELDMSDKDAKEVRQAIGDAVREGLNLRVGSDADMYVNELLKQPVRLLMQVLQDFYTKKYRATSVKIEGEQGNHEKSDELIVPKLLRNALYGSMLSSIYRAGLNYEQHRFGMDSLCKDIFTYVKQDRDFNTGFYLRPQSESEALRNCSIYLASQVSENCQGSLAKVLQMLLVGCGSVSIFNQFVSGLVQAGNDEDKFELLLNEFIAYMSVGRNESASHWANRCCAVVGDNHKTGIFIGMVQLNRGARKGSVENYKRFDLKRETGLAKAAMAVSLSTVSSSNLMDFTSVFNLIGAVSDLAECGDNDKMSAKVFNKIISRPTCVVPSWNDAATRAEMKTASLELDTELDAQDDNDPSLNGSELPKEFEATFSYIKGWLSKVSDLQSNISPSALLIGKIWTRFYFNLTNIEYKHGSRLYKDAHSGILASQSNAAKIMRFNVLAFLHAVLVEEDLYHSVGQSGHLGDGLRENPVTSIDVFEKKLRDIKESMNETETHWKKAYPLFYLLVSCPLFHPFIFPVGGVNRSAAAYEKERSLNNILCEIGIGDSVLSEEEWRKVFKKEVSDDDAANSNGDETSSDIGEGRSVGKFEDVNKDDANKIINGKIISHLNISYVAIAAYDKTTPARTKTLNSGATE